jgi:cell division protease FtsH
LLKIGNKKNQQASKRNHQKSNSSLDQQDKKKPNLQEPSKTILVWLLIAIAIVFGLRFMQNYGEMREQTLTYSQFQNLINSPDAKIIKMEIALKGINRAILRGEVSDPTIIAKIVAPKQIPPQVKVFTVVLPFLDSNMLKEWDSRGLQYSFLPEKFNWSEMLWSNLFWILPMIIIWLFMIRQMQSGQKGIFSFGKSRAKLQNMDRPQNTFADAAGLDEAKAELEEIIEFLKKPQKFKRLGGKIPKGVLLLGPPGTGKTLLARCVAGEAGVPFLSMSGSDFVEMFVGVGASRVRDLFDTAKKNSPCIIFIDEIDAVGRQRGAGLGGGHDEREQTLNQILVEMDGFEVNSGVIVMAATNRPDVLDPALLRPGRFDRQIVVDVPDIKGREGILKVHTRNIPLAEDVDLHIIARGTPGFVGADLANLVNEAALLAARYGQDKVTMLDFEEAKDKVLMGVERKSMVLSDDERRKTAYHEAGHAICNIYCKEADPLHKVTIIPRGRALGVTFSLPGEDKHSYTRDYLLDRICIILGGRVAEEIVFNTMTTGAANDIKQATDIVRKFVCDYGMTPELGLLSYGEKDEQIFLGREFNRRRDFSEKTAQIIDEVMKKIVDQQYQRAKNILTEHRIEVDRLANALLEYEMLDREEIMKVINGMPLEAPKKSRSLNKRPEIKKEDSKQQQEIAKDLISKRSSHIEENKGNIIDNKSVE